MSTQVVREQSDDVVVKEKGWNGLTPRVIVLLVVFAVLASFVSIGTLRIPIPGDGFQTLAKTSEIWLPNSIGIGCLVILSVIAFKAKGIAKLLHLDLAPSELVVIYICTGFINLMASERLLISVIANMGNVPFEYLEFPEDFPWFNVSSHLFIWDFDAAFNMMIGGTSVPWLKLIMPWLLWFIFFGAVFFLLFVMGSIFYQRWHEAEKLRFPLVIPIITTVETLQGVDKQVNKFFIAGLAVPILINGLSILHRYYPGIPTVALRHFRAGDIFVGAGFLGTVLTEACGFHVHIYPFAIGIGYLVMATGLCFSIWFFYFVYRFIMKALLISIGIGGLHQEFLLAYQFHGGRWALGAFLLWMARGSIKNVVYAAVGRSSNVPERTAISPVVILFGTIVAVLVIMFYGVFLFRTTLPVMVFILFDLLLMNAACARFRSEAGNPFLLMESYGVQHVSELFGRAAVDRSAYTGANASFFSKFGRGLSSGTGWLTDAFNLADKTGMPRRNMFLALILSVVLLFAVVGPVTIKILYSLGLQYRIGVKGFSLLSEPSAQIVDGLQYSQLFVLLGVVMTLFLSAMHARYAWWPFHPVGYVLMHEIGTVSWASIAASFFIAWLVKALIWRWFGKHMYDRLRPFFSALIIGDMGMGFIATLLTIGAYLRV